MDDVKVFTPEVIDENPFPQDQIKADNTTTYSPTEIADQPMPSSMIANELVSQSLNTQTKNILGEFRFTPTGALQVGKYLPNSSGDIRISPNGIVARNSNGVTTFTIDGTTGNAAFLGAVLAGSLISGNITLGGVGNGDGILIVKDASGNIILRADKDGYHAYDILGTEKVKLAAGNGLEVYGEDGKTITFRQIPGGTEYGTMSYYEPGNAIQLYSANGKGMVIYGDERGSFFSQEELLLGSLNSNVKIAVASGILDVQASTSGFSGDVSIVGNLAVGGFKSSIADTKSGKVLLYANESPDNWFTDFCDSKDKINPTFLEVTIPPYKFIKCDDGTFQVWGKRKGFENKERRFEKISKKVPYINNFKKENFKELFKQKRKSKKILTNKVALV